jgi:cbb3-type cytochrome oxidase subunit 3
MEDWTAIYKFGRLALLAAILVGIAIYVYSGSRKERLERPALRMLEEDDE